MFLPQAIQQNSVFNLRHMNKLLLQTNWESPFIDKESCGSKLISNINKFLKIRNNHDLKTPQRKCYFAQNVVV